MQDWRIGSFAIASDKTIHHRVGLLSGNIAIDERGAVDGVPAWALTHVPTGLRVVMLNGVFGDIIGPADEIAACADWSFTTLPPPRNARDALIAVMQRYPDIIEPGAGPAGTPEDVKRVQAGAVA